MAKDKAGKKSAISESGVLSLDSAQHERAMKTKDWRGGGGGTLLPINSDGYEFIIDKITRDVSAGEKTAGSPNYRLEARFADDSYPEGEGTKANLFFIAHGNTAGKYLKFLEVAGGIDPENIDPKAVPIPSQKEVDGWTGQHILISVDGHSAPHNNPTSDKKYNDYSLVARVGGGKKAKKVGAGKIAK